MSLSNWAQNGWLKSHTSSPQEVANLLRIVDREIGDAAVHGISLDAQLGMQYNAALKLADIALRSSGYRAATGGSQHRPRTSGSSAEETERSRMTATTGWLIDRESPP